MLCIVKECGVIDLLWVVSVAIVVVEVFELRLQPFHLVLVVHVFVSVEAKPTCFCFVNRLGLRFRPALLVDAFLEHGTFNRFDIEQELEHVFEYRDWVRSQVFVSGYKCRYLF